MLVAIFVPVTCVTMIMPIAVLVPMPMIGFRLVSHDRRYHQRESKNGHCSQQISKTFHLKTLSKFDYGSIAKPGVNGQIVIFCLTHATLTKTEQCVK